MRLKPIWQSLLGGIVFYTIIPIPSDWELEIKRIARWAPLLGLVIGVILNIADYLFWQINLPIWTRTVLILAIWLSITGGLHLDGAMDTADGLGVLDPEKRITVMQDSRSGAFGVMAAIFILLLKLTTLVELDSYRGWVLITAPVWGRWAQVLAIAYYPYLKPEGKGAFHKDNLVWPGDGFLGLLILILLHGGWIILTPDPWWWGIILMLLGFTSSLSSIFWFYRQLKGFTGDTYGAVVEWTEVIYLCLVIILIFPI